MARDKKKKKNPPHTPHEKDSKTLQPNKKQINSLKQDFPQEKQGDLEPWRF